MSRRGDDGRRFHSPVVPSVVGAVEPVLSQGRFVVKPWRRHRMILIRTCRSTLSLTQRLLGDELRDRTLLESAVNARERAVRLDAEAPRVAHLLMLESDWGGKSTALRRCRDEPEPLPPDKARDARCAGRSRRRHRRRLSGFHDDAWTVARSWRAGSRTSRASAGEDDHERRRLTDRGG